VKNAAAFLTTTTMADDPTRKIGDAIPIAQLNPQLPDTSSSAIRAVVTIVWPYNSAKDSVSCILAEPEFRLRPAKGQVRVNFAGPGAKAFSEHRLGSGDEVLLSLSGAHWELNDAKGPMEGLGWQLRFSERLLLQVRMGFHAAMQHFEPR
jgi:hypothetical protein